MNPVDGLIYKELLRGKEPDPHVIARRLLSRLDPEHTQEIVMYGLVERVQLCQRQVRAQRHFETNGDEKDDDAPSRGPSKWEAYRRAAPFDVHKFEDELTVEDLRYIVDRYDAQIAGMNAARDYYANLLVLVERAGVPTVGDLDVGEAAA